MVQARRPKVSLCMIVRNEEGNLEDCLSPVASLFDEIVIVDTGSQDRTKEVASRFTAKIFDFPWCDDFSAARNEALRRAHGEWIFWLDADDRLSPENVDKLAQLLESLGDEPQAYSLDTVVHGQFACDGMQLLAHLRLFRAHPDIRWRGRVHEQLQPSLAALNYEVAASDVQIEHVGYQSQPLRQRKLQRDIRLLRMDFAVDPSDRSTLLHLALAYAERNDREAKIFLSRIIELGPPEADHMRRVHDLIAEILRRDGQLEEALFSTYRALQQFPGDEALRFKQAEILYDLQQYSTARGLLQELLASPPQQRHPFCPALLREKLAPRMIGETQSADGLFDEAIAALTKVLERFPDDTRTWYALGGVYSQRGQIAELEGVCEKLQACPQGPYFASVLMAMSLLRRRDLPAVAKHLDWLISELPQAALPRALRCELLELQGAPPAARIQACRDVLRLDPSNRHIAAQLAQLEKSVLAAPAASPVYQGQISQGQINQTQIDQGFGCIVVDAAMSMGRS